MKGGKPPPLEPAGRKGGGAEKVALGEWSEEPHPLRRTFPGPRGADVPLRVAMERKAFADVVGHAKESLDAEICGVLAGQVCEDDEGLFVHVEAAIRGVAAHEANTRVTFTQETWKTVHETLERDYPNLRMVGWYHSHPGFGVEFSEMDVFIQKNFFPSPTQIALLTDPLGGDMSICRNAEKGVSYLDRFWVDGREHTLRAPAPPPAGKATGVASSGVSELDVRNIEARLSQLIQAVDEQRTSFYRFLTTLLVMALTGIVCWVAYGIYSSYTSRLDPPQLNGYVPVPMRVGDKTIMIGVGVVQWDVPPELNAAYIEAEKQREAGEKAGPSKPDLEPVAPSASVAPAVSPAPAQPGSSRNP